jgi:hypothetical protein
MANSITSTGMSAASTQDRKALLFGLISNPFCKVSPKIPKIASLDPLEDQR